MLVVLSVLFIIVYLWLLNSEVSSCIYNTSVISLPGKGPKRTAALLSGDQLHQLVAEVQLFGNSLGLHRHGIMPYKNLSSSGMCVFRNMYCMVDMDSDHPVLIPYIARKTAYSL